MKVSYARHVAKKTRDLTAEQAAHVDSRIAEVADGRISWTRFDELLTGAIAAADPEAAAERERTQAQRQFAHPTRSTQDGMRGFHIRAPFHVIAVLDARVAWLADMLGALGDTDPIDHRRVKAIAILANPHLALELVTAPRHGGTDPPTPRGHPTSPSRSRSVLARSPSSTGRRCSRR